MIESKVILPISVNQVNVSLEVWLGSKGDIRDFINDDSLAIQLMPELVKRHYTPTLQYDYGLHQWKFHISPESWSRNGRAVIMTGSTIAQAICLGILRLEKVKDDQKQGLLED
jgi:hypothetical protein